MPVSGLLRLWYRCGVCRPATLCGLPRFGINNRFVSIFKYNPIFFRFHVTFYPYRILSLYENSPYALYIRLASTAEIWAMPIGRIFGSRFSAYQALFYRDKHPVFRCPPLPVFSQSERAFYRLQRAKIWRTFGGYRSTTHGFYHGTFKYPSAVARRLCYDLWLIDRLNFAAGVTGIPFRHNIEERGELAIPRSHCRYCC